MLRKCSGRERRTKGGDGMSNTYKTISGDMWDSIAFKALGGERETNRLIKANLQYRETVIFPAGVVLRLPAIEPEISAALPPWKEAGNE